MRLAAHLKSTDTSFSDFAARVGRTPEAVRLWAKGKRMPGTADVVKIEQVTVGAVTVVDHHNACVEHLGLEGREPKKGSHDTTMAASCAPVTVNAHG